MNCVVLKKGKYFNYSYSSLRWDPWGQPTEYKIIVCESWQQGFKLAKELGHDMVLFVDSGTVFNDVDAFAESLKTYPHQGLIGHIIDPLDKDKFYSLHPQCFLINVNQFDEDVFADGEFVYPSVQRSSQNIHDEYTPLWLKPMEGQHFKAHTQNDFGQKILARQLMQNKIVSNWHQKIRDNKIYLYRDEIRDDWLQRQQCYVDLAEKHLWILNNQPTRFIDSEHLISPASGLFWMLGTTADSIDLVDISHWQLKLVQSMIDSWDGAEYGKFVYNFIVKNKIRHVQFDCFMSDTAKLELLSNKQRFCEYVDQKFAEQLKTFSTTPENFINQWKIIKHKQISLNHENMVDWLLQANLSNTTGIWLSNILEYKYTWIKSTDKDIQQCKNRIVEFGCKVEL